MNETSAISNTALKLFPAPNNAKLKFYALIALALAAICIGNATIVDSIKPEKVEALWFVGAPAAILAAILSSIIKYRNSEYPDQDFLSLIPENSDCYAIPKTAPITVIDRTNEKIYFGPKSTVGKPYQISFSSIKNTEWQLQNGSKHIALYLNQSDSPYLEISYFGEENELKRDFTVLNNALNFGMK